LADGHTEKILKSERPARQLATCTEPPIYHQCSRPTGELAIVAGIGSRTTVSAMGAWGLGPFDNDAAADWAGDLDDAAPKERSTLIRDALTAAIEAEEYLDGDEAATAIAAAAVVAAKQPDGPELDNNYGPNADTVGSLRLEPDLRVLATRALVRALGEASEWRELWEEAGQFDEARRALDPVLSALNNHTAEASDR